MFRSIDILKGVFHQLKGVCENYNVCCSIAIEDQLKSMNQLTQNILEKLIW